MWDERVTNVKRNAGLVPHKKSRSIGVNKNRGTVGHFSPIHTLHICV